MDAKSKAQNRRKKKDGMKAEDDDATAKKLTGYKYHCLLCNKHRAFLKFKCHHVDSTMGSL